MSSRTPGGVIGWPATGGPTLASRAKASWTASVSPATSGGCPDRRGSLRRGLSIECAAGGGDEVVAGGRVVGVDECLDEQTVDGGDHHGREVAGVAGVDRVEERVDEQARDAVALAVV